MIEKIENTLQNTTKTSGVYESYRFSTMFSMDDIDNISKEKVEELRNIFNTFDDDGSGSITVEEFQYALTKMNVYLPKDQVREMIWEYDTDGDCNLDFDEFLKLISRLDPRIGQEIEINKAFKLFDKNHDGYISKTEIVDALNHFGITATDEDIEMLFSITDDNDDGMISHAEFRNILFDAAAPEMPLGGLPGSTSPAAGSPRASSPRSGRR
ncbi:hypothetical protein ACHWQZ_G007990 [Mnemiopsis leidyi]